MPSHAVAVSLKSVPAKVGVSPAPSGRPDSFPKFKRGAQRSATAIATVLFLAQAASTVTFAAEHAAQPVSLPASTSLSAAAIADAKAAADADAAVSRARAALEKADNDLKAAAAGAVLTAGALAPALAAAQAEKMAADVALVKAMADAQAAHAKADQSAAAPTTSTHPSTTTSGTATTSQASTPVHVPPPSGTTTATSTTGYVPPPRSTTTATQTTTGYVPPPSGTTSTTHSTTGYVPAPSGATTASQSTTTQTHTTPQPTGATSSGSASSSTNTPSSTTASTSPAAHGGAMGSGRADSSSTPPHSSPAYGPDTSAAQDTGGQGSRALRDFPIIAGLVRKSYYSSQRESSEELNTNYSTKLSPKEVAAKYEEQLKNADWNEIDRSESGDAAAYSLFVRRQWKRLSETADIRITQTSTNGSEIYLAITLSRTGILASSAADLDGINVDVAPASGSPNDQGERDPANIPRIANSVRKSYSSSGSGHENAVYRAKVTLVQAEAFFVNRLSEADWEETGRREVGDAEDASHKVSLFMTLGGRTVEIQLKEIQAKVTEITVQTGS